MHQDFGFFLDFGIRPKSYGLLRRKMTCLGISAQVKLEYYKSETLPNLLKA